jgi:hypothetical protein
MSFRLIRRRIHRFAKDTSTGTVLQSGSLTEHRNILRTRLRAWELLLPVYMPGLAQFQATGVSSSSTSSQFSTTALQNSPNSENTNIWLPSRIPISHRSRVCQPGLPEIEERVRTAQCFDALDAVRHVLQIKTRMVEFKNKNARGQREGLRSRTIIDRVHERARRAAEKYRVARAAKFQLSGPGDWENSLQILNDKDVRGYQDPDRMKLRTGRLGTLDDDQVDAQRSATSDTTLEPTPITSEFSLFNQIRHKRDGTGETRRTLSWIWSAKPPNITDDDENDDILRTEWAKSRARVTRCKEEVMLLKEEMRRVLAFLNWKLRWWQEREEKRKNVDSALLEGLRAYATKQGILQECLSVDFVRMWQSMKNDTQILDPDEDDEDDEGEGSEHEDGMDGNDDDDDPMED